MQGLAQANTPLGSFVGGAPPKQGGINTTPGFFKNTGGGAPGNGHMGTVPVPPRSREGAASAVFASPTGTGDDIEDVMGLSSNASVPNAKIMRAMQHDFMIVSQVYQVIVTRMERRDPLLKRRGRERRRYNMFNIPAANFLIASVTKAPASHKEVQSAKQFLDGADPQKPGAFIASGWYPEGVNRSEEGAEEMYHNGAEVARERLLNNVVRGHAVALNVWGNRVSPGTTLWLIVKKAPVDANRTFKTRPWGKEAGKPMPTDGRSTRPFQFSYYADSRQCSPPMSVLEYQDEFGFTHYGEAIRFGKASSFAPQNPNYRDVKKAPFNFETSLLQPPIEMFVNT